MLRRTAVIAMVLVFAASSALLAQQRQHRHQGRHMGNQGAGMMAQIDRFRPTTLLSEQDALGLSPAQVEELTQLEEKAAQTRDAAMTGHDQNRARLMDALSAVLPDPTAVRGYFDAAHASMGAAHWADVDAALKAMQVLTDEQRRMVRQGTGSGS